MSITAVVQRIQRFYFTARYLSAAQVTCRARRMVRRKIWALLGKRMPAPQGVTLRTMPDFLPGLADVSKGGPGQDNNCDPGSEVGCVTPCAPQHLEQTPKKQGCSATHSAHGVTRPTQNCGWQTELDAIALQARGVVQGQFTFLNRTVAFKHDPGWNDPDLSQLWRYHLHYFHYTLDLLTLARLGEEDAAWACFRRLCKSWIEKNQEIKGDGWHPYTISLRAVNWLHAARGFAPQFDSDLAFRNEFLSSLCGQLQILAGDLEHDVRGNHLLENLRALIWGGLSFEGAEARRWLNQGLKLLELEVKEQVLADGGHFERSPGYHCLVLKDLLEIAIWLQRNDCKSPPWLSAAIRRMLDYLMIVTQPEFRVPLLKDTAWDAAPAVEDLFAVGAVLLADQKYKRSERFGLYPLLLFGKQGWRTFQGWPVNREPRQSSTLTHSGHYVFVDDEAGDHLLLDAGKVCPDYLPAHAHADLLSYELMVGGEPVVVDSGIFEYTSGRWRDFFRATRAHNTVEVDGQNQSEVWSSFRVARRAAVRVCEFRVGAREAWLRGEHDGYRRLSVPTLHRRTLLWHRSGFWLVFDELIGSGSLPAHSYLHLHPALTPARAGESWKLNGSGVPVHVTPFGCSDARVVCGDETEPQGWYSEHFGERRANPVLVFSQEGALPIRFGYVIAKRAAAGVEMRTVDSDRVEIGIRHENVNHAYVSTQKSFSRIE